MTRLVMHLTAILLGLTGTACLVLYGLAASGVLDDTGDIREWGLFAGVGAVAIIAAALIQVAVTRPQYLSSVGFPPLWISAAAFVLVLASGGVAVGTDWSPAAEPLLAIAGASVIFTFFARVVAVWSPGKRVPGVSVIVPAIWGMIAATSLSILVQLVAVAGLFSAVLLGLSVADVTASMDAVDQLVADDGLTASGSALAGTATVTLVVLGVYAIVAPLTEELLKFIGITFIFRRRSVQRYPIFAAGVFAGLGFAVVETLGFALGSGESWPILLGVRAPVALIHIAGTSLIATGWYLQRTRGGIPLVGYFTAAVLVHGAWNGLLATLMLMVSRQTDLDTPGMGFVLAALAICAVLALLLIGCAVWLVINARRQGKAFTGTGDVSRSQLALADALRLQQFRVVPSSFGSEG